MLTYCRPAGSATERAFIARYVSSIPGADRDACRNYHVQVGESDVLWSCHTDTVHRHGGRQAVCVDRGGRITLAPARAKAKGKTRGPGTGPGPGKSNCLGADDTVGVFIMREMITAGVPGHYVFHYGEECGGIGSGNLAYSDPGMLAGYRFAIAFDRRGTGDVITHQSGGRCASDAFAYSLAAQLTTVAEYAPAHGIYTDTAEYASLIPECTNISVGYMYEHQEREEVDAAHVMTLITALRHFDERELVCARDPFAREKRPARNVYLWDDDADDIVEETRGYTEEECAFLAYLRGR